MFCFNINFIFVMLNYVLNQLINFVVILKKNINIMKCFVYFTLKIFKLEKIYIF